MDDKESVIASGLPRYQRAAHHRRLLLQVFWVCALLVGLLLVGLWRGWLDVWQPVLVATTAMLLVLMAIVQSVWWLTRWRVLALAEVPDLQADPSTAPSQGSSSKLRIFARLRRASAAGGEWLTRHTGAAAATGTAVLATLTLIVVGLDWTNEGYEPAFAVPAYVVAGGLLSLGFLLLVLERHYLLTSRRSHSMGRGAHSISHDAQSGGHDAAKARSAELPEALPLAYVLRVAITAMVLLAAGVLLLDTGRQWPQWLLTAAAILPTALAVELLLRALLSAFAPPQPQEPELLADSLLASLWRWPFRPLQYLQDELNKSFGIDLRQSWAFAYIRRALLPVTGALLAIAWLLTGLHEIPLDARGIYERLGRPVAVWQPGFHLGLPWPLGRVQRVENGVVHELAAATASDDDSEFPTPPEADTAEGPPPSSANRLWDASHVAEKSQVIASRTGNDSAARQSFHIVNMDVRFMYRIGLSDSAALASRYNSEDLPGLIRSTAGRILVNYFASRTLEGVLGERRTQLAQEIGSHLQADLDALNSGVEIMTTVVESIHPPAAAAYSYHSVQAAQIRSQAIIARERGNAAQDIHLAHLRAGMTTDQANAGARETLATAEAAERRFAAERDAYATGGKAFLLEQYLAQLSKGLGSARLVLVDHRLDTTAAAVDLRNFPGAAALPLAARRPGTTEVTVDPYDK